MPRLPEPGKDSGVWGNVLNEFLSQAHQLDGTLKPGIVSEGLLDNSVQAKLNAVAGTPGWSDIIDKPSVIAAGSSQSAARAAIGAGTSDLTIGTTNSTAKAGDYQPVWSDIGNKPAIISAGVSAIAARAAIGITSQYVAVPTGVAATDTVAIQAAHDALPSAGGDIILQRGLYQLSPEGITITKQVNLVGAGGWGDGTNYAATWLNCDDPNATAITITVGGCVLRDFILTNQGNPVSGYGIKMTNVSSTLIRRINVQNFYDNIRLEAGDGGTAGDGYWRMEDCFINAPVRYGLFTSNSLWPDNGDGLITGCAFDPRGAGRTSNPDAAIRWESGGGLRISHCKVNGQYGFGPKFTTGIDFAMESVGNHDFTSDLFVIGNSIENCAVDGIKFSRQGGGGRIHMVQVMDNQFQGEMTGRLIDIGAGYEQVQVDGTMYREHYVGGGVAVRAGAGPVFIGPNNHWGMAYVPVYLESPIIGGSKISLQSREGDGYIFNDQSGSSDTKDAPSVDYNYQRSINFTPTSTPTALWTFVVDDYTAGAIAVTVTGILAGVGSFMVEKRISWSQSAGVTTLAGIGNDIVVGTGVDLSFAASPGGIIVAALAITDGTDIQVGKANLRVEGMLSQLKVGA